jgi:(heptosyl)LPS beta-1,4-glucosyltransferase
MIKLSVIIIAKNAENLIVDCIESVAFSDEIVVVDNHSTDRTVDIAKRHKAQVISTDTNDFAKQRNMGLKKAKGKWVLYIDTDERVTPELAASIKLIIENKDSLAGYRITRQNFYFGNQPWPQQEKLERLFQKSKLQEWYGQLHETARVNGEIGNLEGLLLHYTHRDLTSMLSKTIEWSKIEAQLRFDAGHPQMTWWRFPRVMVTAFYGSFIKQKGYKAGAVGVIESMYQAFSMFITYARLWEMQQNVSE